jgi:hypothetical protein
MKPFSKFAALAALHIIFIADRESVTIGRQNQVWKILVQ